MISGALSIVAVAAAAALVDRIGRKPILVFGSCGMSVTLAVVSFAFTNAERGFEGTLMLEGIYGPMALVAANLYVAFFNFSWGPVMWVMLGEMFPNQIWGTGLAVSGLAQWAANFAVTMTFPIMLTRIWPRRRLRGLYGLCVAIDPVRRKNGPRNEGYRA